jgi:hypothetical protein
VDIPLDIFASISKKTILANDPTGNSSSLEYVVNIFETHVGGFWEEEVGDGNNYGNVENRKYDVTM